MSSSKLASKAGETFLRLDTVYPIKLSPSCVTRYRSGTNDELKRGEIATRSALGTILRAFRTYVMDIVNWIEFCRKKSAEYRWLFSVKCDPIGNLVARIKQVRLLQWISLTFNRLLSLAAKIWRLQVLLVWIFIKNRSITECRFSQLNNVLQTQQN